MKLKKILKEIPIQEVKGSKELEITGISINSKFVAPGNLFIAKRGNSEDGSKYIPEAISAGASAILSDIYDPFLKGVTQLIHPDINAIEASLAAHFYQFPSQELFAIGITGTNGKTTTSFLIKHIFDNLNGPCGLIGTIEYIVGQQHYQATRTTPDVTSNHKMLREMVKNDCKSVVMEVSSHALVQERVALIDFDVAIFTNLTTDHLDYHHTMDNYCMAKKKLFDSLNLKTNSKKNYFKTAWVNADSPWHKKLTENTKATVKTFAINTHADLVASNIQMSESGTIFNITYNEETFQCHSPLIGRFNVYNVLGAIGAALSRGYLLPKILPVIRSFSSVSGRLERILNPLNLNIYVDFAHSEDALTNILSCLKELNPKRIITVFGCGGDRDQTKRPKMAEAAEKLSDISIITSDNPRSEDPMQIINHIIQGFKNKTSYQIEPDRYRAIEQAIQIANKEDVILIAGKGHESYQIFAHRIFKFDDREVAKEICQKIANIK